MKGLVFLLALCGLSARETTITTEHRFKNVKLASALL